MKTWKVQNSTRTSHFSDKLPDGRTNGRGPWRNFFHNSHFEQRRLEPRPFAFPTFLAGLKQKCFLSQFTSPIFTWLYFFKCDSTHVNNLKALTRGRADRYALRAEQVLFLVLYSRLATVTARPRLRAEQIGQLHASTCDVIILWETIILHVTVEKCQLGCELVQLKNKLGKKCIVGSAISLASQPFEVLMIHSKWG
jgi:hypothetical protein